MKKKRMVNRLLAILLTVVMTVVLFPMTALASAAAVDHAEALSSALAWLREEVTEPEFGNEWVVLARARGGHNDRVFFDRYLSNVLRYVMEHADDQGRLDIGFPTENTRLILALTAIGVDATDVYGRNLIAPLSEMTWLTGQGLNAVIFALIALNSGGYGDQATVDALIKHMLDSQEDGGYWDAWGWGPDADTNAMALQALAPHRTRPDVNNAITKTLNWLSDEQTATGGWGFGSDNAFSISQVIIALTALDINPQQDARFVKADGNPVTALLHFHDVETGGFLVEDWMNPGVYAVNPVATEQAAHALVAFDRFVRERPALFDMSDAVSLVSNNVQPAPITKVALRSAIVAAEALISANYTRTSWNTMRNALYAAQAVEINVNAMQREINSAAAALRAAIAALEPGWKMMTDAAVAQRFDDINVGRWYTSYVAWAFANGIANGITGGVGGGREFRPTDNVTRAQFAAFLYRMAVGGTPPVSAELGFSDMNRGQWHHDYVAWAHREGIVTGFTGDNTFRPNQPITREQLVTMLNRYIYNLQGGSAPANALNRFPDSGDVTGWARGYVNWGAYHGIIGDASPPMLNPLGSASRSQAVAMLYRTVETFDLSPP